MSWRSKWVDGSSLGSPNWGIDTSVGTSEFAYAGCSRGRPWVFVRYAPLVGQWNPPVADAPPRRLSDALDARRHACNGSSAIRRPDHSNAKYFSRWLRIQGNAVYNAGLCRKLGPETRRCRGSVRDSQVKKEFEGSAEAINRYIIRSSTKLGEQPRDSDPGVGTKQSGKEGG